MFATAFVLPLAPAGDSAVAAALLEAGKKALTAKKFDEATAMFRKALAEDPALLEAAYWIAAAEEKGGNETAALADYRQFLDRLDKKGGSATAEEQKLRPLAEKRVEALAVWETEYLKFEDKYVGELLALATDRAEREPWLAVRALDIVLGIRPKYPAALALRERIVGKGGGGDGLEIFPEVKEWRDLLAEQALRPVEGIVTYSDNILTMDMHGSKFGFPRKPVTTGPSYAYEIEFRVLETYEDNWNIGLAFGTTKDSVFVASLRRAAVVLQAGGRNDKARELESRPVAPKDLSTWRRLSVGVRGDNVQVWLDGKKLLDERITERTGLVGDVGVTIAGCKSEWRVLRTGNL